MSKPNKYHHLLRALAGTSALFIFLIATNPGKVALGFLVIPILLIVFVIYELACFVLRTLYTSGNSKRQRTMSIIIAVAAGMLVMLQSIGQAGAGDFAIVLFFVLVSIFYVSRFR